MKRIRSLETIKGITGLILVDIFQYCFFFEKKKYELFFKRKLSSLEIVPVVILEVDCDSLVFS